MSYKAVVEKLLSSYTDKESYPDDKMVTLFCEVEAGVLHACNISQDFDYEGEIISLIHQCSESSRNLPDSVMVTLSDKFSVGEIRKAIAVTKTDELTTTPKLNINMNMIARNAGLRRKYGETDDQLKDRVLKKSRPSNDQYLDVSAMDVGLQRKVNETDDQLSGRINDKLNYPDMENEYPTPTNKVVKKIEGLHYVENCEVEVSGGTVEFTVRKRYVRELTNNEMYGIAQIIHDNKPITAKTKGSHCVVLHGSVVINFSVVKNNWLDILNDKLLNVIGVKRVHITNDAPDILSMNIFTYDDYRITNIVEVLKSTVNRHQPQNVNINLTINGERCGFVRSDKKPQAPTKENLFNELYDIPGIDKVVIEDVEQGLITLHVFTKVKTLSMVDNINRAVDKIKPLAFYVKLIINGEVH